MKVRCSPPRLEALAFDGDELSAGGSAARPVSSTVDAAPGGDESEDFLLPSARAVAAAIRRASAASPVEFVLRMEKDVRGGLAGPSPDFLRLCVEQMDLFRMVVDREAVLSVSRCFDWIFSFAIHT